MDVKIRHSMNLEKKIRRNMNSGILGKIKDLVLKHYLWVYAVYFIVMFLGTTTVGIDYPVLGRVIKSVKYVAYMLFVIRILFILPEYKKAIFEDKWSHKPLLIKLAYIFIIAMILGLTVNMVLTGNKRLLLVGLVVIAGFKIDYLKLFKLTLITQIILCSTIVLLSSVDLLQNFPIARSQSKMMRYSLGFLYPTNLAQFVMISSVIFMFFTRLKTKWRDLFIMQLINGLVYFITNSRTEFIVLETCIIIIAVIKLISNTGGKRAMEVIKRGFSKGFTYSFFTYPFISLAIVFQYPSGGIWRELNKALSGRLSQTYNDIKMYGLKIFGVKFKMVGRGLDQKATLEKMHNKSNYVDNEYIQMMFKEGVLVAVCFIALLTILLLVLLKLEKYREILLCAVFLLFGILNPRIIRLEYCPILLMFIPAMLEYGNRRRRDRTDEIMRPPTKKRV
ncbi:MAG: hypothetical protein E7F64_06785 [Clostridiales bacterium]|nr:hypothetical protein [Clostridiales bacterium]